MIRLRQLSKVYRQAAVQRGIFNQIDLDLVPAQLYALLGRSGAGKTTLLNILGGLDRDFVGEVEVFGQVLGTLNSAQLAEYRRQQVGFVFQDFHLLHELSIMENLLLSTRFDSAAERQRLRKRAQDCLEKLGLGDRAQAWPGELSGGERQRVALARALLREPKLILADEPTGNLDAVTGSQILDLLLSITRDQDITVLMATHDVTATQRADRCLKLDNGTLQLVDCQ